MYDVIVVGARCAGATTAMHLAQKGYKVLLTDRATFPSDTLSTHMIWSPGLAYLKRWGLLDPVSKSNCPAIREIAFDMGEFVLQGGTPPAFTFSTACGGWCSIRSSSMQPPRPGRKFAKVSPPKN